MATNPFERLHTLPSGKQVALDLSTPADTSWHARQSGPWWLVCRPHSVLLPPSLSYFFDGPTPIKLDEADARALVRALNGE